MRHASRWAAALLLVGGALLSGCARSAAGTAAPGADKPARVETVAGTEAKKVILTEQAVARLGIRTETVSLTVAAAAAGGGTATRTTVPYSALLYDTKGQTWVFEEVEPNSYLRRKVDVEVVDGETVVMRSGLPLAARVVTVGAAMLYGAELGTGI
jgi:hypothetical protein